MLAAQFHTFFLTHVAGDRANLHRMIEMTPSELVQIFTQTQTQTNNNEMATDVVVNVPDEERDFELVYGELSKIQVEDRLVQSESIWDDVANLHFVGDKTKLTSKAIQELAMMNETAVKTSKLKFSKPKLTLQEITRLFLLAKALERPNWHDMLLLDKNQLVLEQMLARRFPNAPPTKSLRRVQCELNEQFEAMLPAGLRGVLAFLSVTNVDVMISLLAGAPMLTPVTLHGDLERTLTPSNVSSFVMLCRVPTSSHYGTTIEVGSSSSDHPHTMQVDDDDDVINTILANHPPTYGVTEFLDKNLMTSMNDARAVRMLMLLEF